MDDVTRKLLAQYMEHEKHDQRVFAGSSASIEGPRGGGAGILMDVQGGALSREVPITGGVAWEGGDLPTIRKRTPAERAESLANRFWQAVKDHDPAQTEIILKQLYGEAWRAGMPISYDEVKQLAANVMRLAAAKAGASY
jgi:hypothetical protein